MHGTLRLHRIYYYFSYENSDKAPSSTQLSLRMIHAEIHQRFITLSKWLTSLCYLMHITYTC